MSTISKNAAAGHPRAQGRKREDRRTVLARIEKLLSDGASPNLKLVDEKRGFDPYNSGSFDRSKAWARINRR
jgi:hypothetical protein